MGPSPLLSIRQGGITSAQDGNGPGLQPGGNLGVAHKPEPHRTWAVGSRVSPKENCVPKSYAQI